MENGAWGIRLGEKERVRGAEVGRKSDKVKSEGKSKRKAGEKEVKIISADGKSADMKK
ncbi:MAG: hypothetical protein ACLRSW_04715 [Christensenellaceae bacterium]